MYRYGAKLVRVIDGDTAVFTVDLGFRASMELPIRLYAVDTPERGEEGWAEAKEMLITLLGDGLIELHTYKNPEKYGRWLGVIIKDGENLNEKMSDVYT